MNRSVLLFLLAAPLAPAAGRCMVSAVPQVIAAEGAAEPAGDISVDCSGLSAGQAMRGTVTASFSRRIANRRTGDVLEGPVLELETGIGVWSPFAAAAVWNGLGSLTFPSLQWTASSSGSFRLRLRGVRIEGAAEIIQAAVQLSSNERFDFPAPVVTVARGIQALAAALMPTLATRGPAPPRDATFADMVRLGAPLVSARVTENYPAAFAAASSPATQGTRLLLRFSGVPEGVRILLPDAVVGSSGMAPTRSGAFGRAAGPGGLAPMGGPQLLLLRVEGAEVNGQGGRLAVQAAVASQAAGQLREAGFGRGTPFAVYEVAGADPSRLESAEIPAWIAVPPGFDTPFGESVVQPTVSLAPLSEVEGAHPSAPIPRYRPVAPLADCEWAGDCAAPWFPRMRLIDPSPLLFTAAAGSGPQIGSAGIRNDGGGLLQWRVSARTRQGSGWLQVDPASGVQNGGVRYDVTPLSLAPGEYAGELVFEQIAPPTGRPDERTFDVRLTVTPASATPPSPGPVPPGTPTPGTAPSISSVSAGPAELEGPFAAGSLITIRGLRFGAQPEVIAGGQPARILTASDTELLVVLPGSLPEGPAAIVVSHGGASSAPWLVPIARFAPVLLFALNEDGDRNGELAPARVGSKLDLYLTGVRPGAAVEVRLHDRTSSAVCEESGQPGVHLVRLAVAQDLPSMQTAVTVTDGGVTSHPLDIWIQ